MFLASDLIQTSWLLKTIAIELKVTSTNQQFSQLTALVKLLVTNSSTEVVNPDFNLTSSFGQVFSSQLTHSFSEDFEPGMFSVSVVNFNS